MPAQKGAHGGVAAARSLWFTWTAPATGRVFFGTGTSARVAQLHARGELPLDRDFVNESFIGTHFVARDLRETTVGPAERPLPAVVPTITGRAWVTGTAQYHLDPADPFPEGFEL